MNLTNYPMIKTVEDLKGRKVVVDNRVDTGTIIEVNNNSAILRIHTDVTDLMGIKILGGYIVREDVKS